MLVVNYWNVTGIATRFSKSTGLCFFFWGTHGCWLGSPVGKQLKFFWSEQMLKSIHGVCCSLLCHVLVDFCDEISSFSFRSLWLRIFERSNLCPCEVSFSSPIQSSKATNIFSKAQFLSPPSHHIEPSHTLQILKLNNQINQDKEHTLELDMTSQVFFF